MGQANLVHGNPLMVDYTPSAAVTAGDVVVIGHMPLIAHSPIAASEKGALAAGGGVYDMLADGPLASGERVWWDDSTNRVTDTETGHTFLGYVAPGSTSTSDGDTIRVIHRPGGDSSGAGSGAGVGSGS